MTKWPRYGHCKTRLSRDIGKERALIVQKRMLEHTLSVAKYLKKNEIMNISIAISGIGLKKSKTWCNKLNINNFNLQGRGDLGERMKRQIILNTRNIFRNKINSFIIIGTDLPNLCHVDLIEAILKLNNNDVILGPSNDGGYWLIGFSKNFIINNSYLPFINIKWSNNDVLKRTIDNLSGNKIKIDYLNSKIDIDTIKDIEQIC